MMQLKIEDRGLENGRRWSGMWKMLEKVVEIKVLTVMGLKRFVMDEMKPMDRKDWYAASSSSADELSVALKGS